MRRVLITGASGFVGRHLVALLRTDPNVSVVELIRTRSGYKAGDNPAFVGDLTDAGFTNGVVQGNIPDIVFHLAAQPSVADSWRNPPGTLVNNLLAQVNILEAVAQWAPKARVMVVGSSEEYGRV